MTETLLIVNTVYSSLSFWVTVSQSEGHTHARNTRSPAAESSVSSDMIVTAVLSVDIIQASLTGYY